MNLIQFIQDTWGVNDKDLIDFLKRVAINTKPSPDDPHDHAHYDKEAPATVDWNPYVGLIENQLTKPRCVAQGCEVIARVHTNRGRGVDYHKGTMMADFDAQALYDLCKQNDGAPTAAGTYPRIGMKILRQDGITEVQPYPGEVYRVKEYWRCKNREEALNDLLTIGPVTVCVKWYLSFSSGEGVLIPKPRDRYVGLHQMCLTRRNEQDNKDEVTRGVNSHGPNFGMDGHFVLPDSQWDSLVTEVWCAK